MNAGTCPFFTIFVIPAINMLMAFVLLFASVKINCMNIRNAAKMELNNVSTHINGYVHEKLNGATPYDLSLQKFGPEILRALQLKYVAPDEVTLTPKLLK